MSEAEMFDFDSGLVGNAYQWVSVTTVSLIRTGSHLTVYNNERSGSEKYAVWFQLMFVQLLIGL